MGALEDLLPEEIKRVSTRSGDEFVVPYLHALTAITIATENDIAILGVDAHEIRQGNVLTVDMANASAEVEFTGDWRAYVRQLNDAARVWVTGHRLGENHGYILTSASQEEFQRLGK